MLRLSDLRSLAMLCYASTHYTSPNPILTSTLGPPPFPGGEGVGMKEISS